MVADQSTLETPAAKYSALRIKFRQVSLLAKVLRSNFVGVVGRGLMPLQAYAREKKSGKTLSCETCYVLVSYRPLALTSRGFAKPVRYGLREGLASIHHLTLKPQRQR